MFAKNKKYPFIFDHQFILNIEQVDSITNQSKQYKIEYFQTKLEIEFILLCVTLYCNIYEIFFLTKCLRSRKVNKFFAFFLHRSCCQGTAIYLSHTSTSGIIIELPKTIFKQTSSYFWQLNTYQSSSWVGTFADLCFKLACSMKFNCESINQLHFFRKQKF